MQVHEPGTEANGDEIDPPAPWSDLSRQPPDLVGLGLVECLQERPGSGDRANLHRHPGATIGDDEIDLAPTDPNVPGLNHHAVGLKEGGGQPLTEGPHLPAVGQPSISSTTTSPKVVILAFLTNRLGR